MELSVQYIAGFFDGEGCISIFYTNVRPRKSNPEKMIRGIKMSILIANTVVTPLEALQAKYGGYIHLSNRRKKSHHKSVYSWRLSNKPDQERFLSDIYPYSVIKSEQIQIALTYLTTNSSTGRRTSQEDWEIRIRCLERMASLNKRGHSVRSIPPSEAQMGWNPAYR